ncbi:MAG: acyl-CoA dehydrogenase family protein, partial [Longimicrobiales bacterium]
MSVMLPDVARSPLTLLNEEEHLFRETVRQFAEETVAPRMRRMEEEGRIDDELLAQLFELGLM